MAASAGRGRSNADCPAGRMSVCHLDGSEALTPSCQKRGGEAHRWVRYAGAPFHPPASIAHPNGASTGSSASASEFGSCLPPARFGWLVFSKAFSPASRRRWQSRGLDDSPRARRCVRRALPTPSAGRGKPPLHSWHLASRGRLTSQIAGAPFRCATFRLRRLRRNFTPVISPPQSTKTSRSTRGRENSRFRSGYASHTCEAGPPRNLPTSRPKPKSVFQVTVTQPP
jgi:hypothetical protein